MKFLSAHIQFTKAEVDIFKKTLHLLGKADSITSCSSIIDGAYCSMHALIEELDEEHSLEMDEWRAAVTSSMGQVQKRRKA